MCFCITFVIFPIDVQGSGIKISAESAVVINATTGEVLFSLNPYEKRGMASTTKIMTALVALEQGCLTDVTQARTEDVTIEGTSIGLKAGDRITLENLVAGMLLESGNDAANVTATMIGGSKAGFCELMNKKAKALGLTSTQFKNPSGLTEEGHYSTAYDMAVLSANAIKNPEFRRLCSAKKYTAVYGTPEYERTFYNHNKFLDRFDGAFGIKTGFTKASGRCLVTAAQRKGVTLVAVTLNARDDWNDHIKMMEYALSILKPRIVQLDKEKLKIPVVGSHKSFVIAEPSSTLSFHCTKNFDGYSTEIYVNHFLYAGVNKGECVGWVEIKNKNGDIIASSYLLADSNATLKTYTTKSEGAFSKFIKKIRKGLSQRQT